jgi:high-affinity iron transporter
MLRLLLFAGCVAVGAVMLWQGAATSDNRNPFAAETSPSAAILDIGVLVFREGLECVLVLAAVMAGMERDRITSRNPVLIGAGAGFAATLLTWAVAVRILNDLSRSISALALQAATGLLAVIVLLIVMNWFFHKLY